MQFTTFKNRSFAYYFALFGCISTGIVYGAIGLIAILSFLKVKHGGADESSLLAFLDHFILGKVLIWIILLGTLSYILWRIYETVKDPYGYGKDFKGLATRTGIALSTTADALLIYSTIQVLLQTATIQENGEPDELRNLIDDAFQNSWGKSVVIGIGIIVFITAIVQLIYGVTRGYAERLDINHISKTGKMLIHWSAWIGYSARGIILGIIGFFFIKAGLTGNAKWAVNTDKAFDFIGDHVGHVYFIITAIGTICYGIFMFCLGLWYDPDKG
jgi:hypothetical protein